MSITQVHYSGNSSIPNSPSSSSSSSHTPDSSCTNSTTSSPTTKLSPWIHGRLSSSSSSDFHPHHRLLASLYREDGHIYSLAAVGDLLYTGSESKNVRVWKNLRDFSGFKSTSEMVKAIVVVNGKIFTGHQDGKIRVWMLSLDKAGTAYDQVGVLPKTKHFLLKSLTPSNYVPVRRNRSAPWIKHYDTVSCLTVDEDHGLLYSGSWDKTIKVWRISDSKCLESVAAHDDAVNSVTAAADGMVFSGSADGTVKAWRREFVGKRTEHFLVDVLLKQEHAVTAVSVAEGAVYAGSSDGLVRFWDVESRSVEYGGVLRGHKMAVLCMVATGNLVMSGSADKSICVWRRGDGGVHDCLAVLAGHGGPVKCLAAVRESLTEEEEEEEEDHRRWTVYSGSLDKSVKIWRVFE